MLGIEIQAFKYVYNLYIFLLVLCFMICVKINGEYNKRRRGEEQKEETYLKGKCKTNEQEVGSESISCGKDEK